MFLIQCRRYNCTFSILKRFSRIVCFSITFNITFYIVQQIYSIIGDGISISMNETQIYNIIIGTGILFLVIAYNVLLSYSSQLNKKADYLLNSFYEFIKCNALIHFLTICSLIILKNNKDIFNGIIGAYVFFIIIELSSTYRTKINKNESLNVPITKKHYTISAIIFISFNNYLLQLINFISSSRDALALNMELVYIIVIFLG